MSALLALQAAPAVIGLAQMLSGAATKTGGYPDLNIPIPESSKKALSNAEYIASQTQLPGYETAIGNIRETTAGRIGALERGAETSSQLLSGITRLSEQENEAIQGLDIASAQNFQNNQGMLRGELDKMGGMEWEKFMREFQNNELDKYVMQNQKKQALLGAGMQNLVGGAQSFGETASWYNLLDKQRTSNEVQADKNREFLMGLLGGGQTGTQPSSGALPAAIGSQMELTNSPNYFNVWDYITK